MNKADISQNFQNGARATDTAWSQCVEEYLSTVASVPIQQHKSHSLYVLHVLYSSAIKEYFAFENWINMKITLINVEIILFRLLAINFS